MSHLAEKCSKANIFISTKLLLLITLFVTISCKTTLQPKQTNEIINLNAIAIVPHKNYQIEKDMKEGSNEEPETIRFQKNDQDKYCVVPDLTYTGSGLNVIESIKRGEILDNKIVIRDAKGRIIGSDSINFQAFTIVTEYGNFVSLKEFKLLGSPRYFKAIIE